MITYLKNLLAIVLNFTTGHNVFGLGLLAVAIGLKFLLGMPILAAGFSGAFVFKNYHALIAFVKGYVKK